MVSAEESDSGATSDAKDFNLHMVTLVALIISIICIVSIISSFFILKVHGSAMHTSSTHNSLRMHTCILSLTLSRSP
jgi:hypothetical protein